MDRAATARLPPGPTRCSPRNGPSRAWAFRGPGRAVVLCINILRFRFMTQKFNKLFGKFTTHSVPTKLIFGGPKKFLGALHRFCTPNINCRFPPLCRTAGRAEVSSRPAAKWPGNFVPGRAENFRPVHISRPNADSFGSIEAHHHVKFS